MYALDTNTVIFLFKGIGRVKDHFFSKPPKEIVLPAIVVYELEVGILKSSDARKRQGQLKDLIDAVQVCPFGTGEAHAAAQIRARLEKSGYPIGPIDVLIAATAQANGHVLVTNNLKEFKRVHGLRVEDWL